MTQVFAFQGTGIYFFLLFWQRPKFNVELASFGVRVEYGMKMPVGL